MMKIKKFQHIKNQRFSSIEKTLLIFTIISLIILTILTGCVSEHETEEQNNDLKDYSVEIEGKDMKLLTVQEVADLWEINSNLLLEKMTQEFDLKNNYTVNSVLEDIRVEYKFSPALIKDMTEEIKQQKIIYQKIN